MFFPLQRATLRRILTVRHMSAKPSQDSGSLVEKETPKGITEAPLFPTELDINEKELTQLLRESVQGKTPQYDQTPLTSEKMEEINANALLMNKLLQLPQKPSMVKKLERARLSDSEVDFNNFFSTRPRDLPNLRLYIQGLAQRRMFDYALSIVNFFRPKDTDVQLPPTLPKSPQKMIVSELKHYLAVRRLNTQGRKQELVDRLTIAVEDEEAQLAEVKNAEIIRPNLHVYSALLSALKDNELTTEEEEAKINEVMEMMKEDGLEPDAVIYAAIIDVKVSKKRVSTEVLDSAYAIMKILEEKQIAPTPEIFSGLIKGCIRNSDAARAFQTFDHMRVWHCDPDFVIFSQMMFACKMTGEAEKALNFFEEMKDLDIYPTDVTFNSLLASMQRRPDMVKDAIGVLNQMKQMGYKPDEHTYRQLMEINSRGGDYKTSLLLFDEITRLPNWETELKQQGVRALYVSPDLEKHIQKAEQVVQMMLDNGVEMKKFVMDSMLNVYTHASRINRALDWWEKYKEFGLQPSRTTYGHMIMMFTRTRRMERALDMYNKMKIAGLKPSVKTYSDLIMGCTKLDFFMSGLKILREMKQEGYTISPNHFYILNFRRNLTSSPHLVRELDEITGKSRHFVPSWKKEGGRRPKPEFRTVSKKERKMIAREPVWLSAHDLGRDSIELE